VHRSGDTGLPVLESSYWTLEDRNTLPPAPKHQRGNNIQITLLGLVLLLAISMAFPQPGHGYLGSPFLRHQTT